MNEEDLYDDPVFRKALRTRSRWRWGLSALLLGAYLAWAVGGIYFPRAYASPLAGSAISAGMAAGMLIIVLSIALSILYVRVIGRIEASERAGKARLG